MKGLSTTVLDEQFPEEMKDWEGNVVRIDAGDRRIPINTRRIHFVLSKIKPHVLVILFFVVPVGVQDFLFEIVIVVFELWYWFGSGRVCWCCVVLRGGCCYVLQLCFMGLGEDGRAWCLLQYCGKKIGKGWRRGRMRTGPFIVLF